MSAEFAPSPLTVDEFLVWALGRPGRYELESGKVLAMAPEMVRHMHLKGLAYLALRTACRGTGCHALPDGGTVRISGRTAYEPDALVYCGPRLPGDAVEIPEPVIVVEVLSPSTAYRDIGVKLAGYFSLPSVHHYLIVDPDKPLLIHHARGDGDLIATRILSDGALRLDPPGLDLLVEDLLAESGEAGELRPS